VQVPGRECSSGLFTAYLAAKGYGPESTCNCAGQILSLHCVEYDWCISKPLANQSGFVFENSFCICGKSFAVSAHVNSGEWTAPGCESHDSAHSGASRCSH